MEKEIKKASKKVVDKKNTTKKNNVDKETSKKVEDKNIESKKEIKTTPIKVDKEKVKEAEKKNKVYYANNDVNEVKKFIFIMLALIVIVAGIYVCTRAFVTKDLFNKKEDKTEEVTEGSVNYDVASMGTLLNRPYDEYYVVIYDTKEGSYISDMSSLVYSYTQKDNHLHVYTIDLSNKLNEAYYDPENVNVNAKDLSEIKVGDITLIKVKSGKINKFIVDYSKMKTELGVN